MKLNLRRKILSGYLLMIFFIIFIGFTGYYSSHKIKSDLDKMNGNVTQVSKLIDQINYNIASQNNDELIFLLTGDEKYANYVINHSDVIDRTIDSVITIAEPDEKETLTKIKETNKKIAVNSQKAINAYKSGNIDEAKRISLTESSNLREDLEKNCNSLNQALNENLTAYKMEQDRSLALSTVIIFGLTFISSVLAILIALYISQKIVKPIKSVVSSSNKLANGDFSLKEVVVKTNDEAHELAESFNLMVNSVRKLLTEVLKGAEQVSSTSQELSSGADQAFKASEQVSMAIQEIAKGTSEQTQFVNSTMKAVSDVNKAIEQISAGAQEQVSNITVTANMVSEMARSIQEVASSAHIVAMSAEKTREAAGQGKKDVALTIKGINAIKNKVFISANEEIKKLAEHSKQIGEIIQVIDEIAEQTNLLALNAAIEAARAGEHGKGFAVVADEVRKLAERSSKATKEIEQLIHIIQNAISGATLAMDEGVNEVEQGTRLARSAGITLKTIDQAAEETYRQIQNISAAAEEISASSQEVVKAVENVSAISQQNTAATQQLSAGSSQVSMDMNNLASITEESSAATEEVSASTEEVTNSIQEMSNSSKKLSEMADNLKGLLSVFMVKEITENCWDIMNCPPELVEKCPAYGSDEKRCWLIDGTWCGGIQQGNSESKRQRCMNCKAFKKMMEE